MLSNVHWLVANFICLLLDTEKVVNHGFVRLFFLPETAACSENVEKVVNGSWIEGQKTKQWAKRC